MTQVSIPRGLLYPEQHIHPTTYSNVILVDAATEKIALIGNVYWDGRPGSAKTMSAAGGGQIGFRCGAVTFATAGTTIDLGIQDVATGAGPAPQPDGVFDCSRTLAAGTDTITANAWNIFALTGGSGSKSIAHGDLIAIVFDMTARAGADSVVVSAIPITEYAYGGGGNPQRPITNHFTAGAWQGGGGANIRQPNVLLIADDGTLGTLNGGSFSSNIGSETFSDATNPDERGMRFQVPWDCKIDGFFVHLSALASAASDFTLTLYSDPTGTPASVAAITVLAEQMNSVLGAPLFTFQPEISLSRNTDYVLGAKATNTGNISILTQSIGNTAYKPLFQGSSNFAKATRNNGSGAFTIESPALTFYPMGVRISSFDDGTGAGRPTYLLGI